MANLYNYCLNSSFTKLEYDNLLAVEFQCFPGDLRSGGWSQHDYLAFVTSGTKVWVTPEGELPVRKGEALYCKRGGYMLQNYYEEDFCALIFFLPRHFIRETVLEFQQYSSQSPSVNTQNQLLSLEVDLGLEAYFQSVLTYFNPEQKPSPELLKLKFKELLLHVLTGRKNPDLLAYFLSTARKEQANLQQVMQDNYLYRLSLEDFARLCNRSLSAFKRDFQEYYDSSPGKWLTVQRLKYARVRLFTTDETINDIAFHSGFETTSHFIRCFKKYYGLPPLQYRQQTHLIAS